MKALHSQHVEVSKISSASWERWTSSTYGTSQPYPHPPLCRPVIVGRLNSSRKPQCWTWGLVPPGGWGAERKQQCGLWKYGLISKGTPRKRAGLKEKLGKPDEKMMGDDVNMVIWTLSLAAAVFWRKGTRLRGEGALAEARLIALLTRYSCISGEINYAHCNRLCICESFKMLKTWG